MKENVMIAILFMLALALPLSGCTTNAPPPNANVVSPVSSQSPPSTLTSTMTSDEVPPADSIYTGLDERSCKEIELGANDQGAIYKAECPGVGGYKVILMASDHSNALTIVDKKGKATDLRVRDGLNTAANFRLGDKIEWRMQGKGGAAVPIAFIVRALKSIDPVDLNKVDSNMLVGKLGATPCITDVIGPSVTDQNTKARELADTAKDRPCVPKMR